MKQRCDWLRACARVLSMVRVLPQSAALLATQPHASVFLNSICLSLGEKGKC